MRKKLLALLMCATMVLGSSAVSFAAESDATEANAKAIAVTNGNKIVDEYDSTAKVQIKVGDYTWGFETSSAVSGHTAARVSENNGDQKLIYKLDVAVDATRKGNLSVSADSTAKNPVGIAVANALYNNGQSVARTLKAGTSVIVLSKALNGDQHYTAYAIPLAKAITVTANESLEDLLADTCDGGNIEVQKIDSNATVQLTSASDNATTQATIAEIFAGTTTNTAVALETKGNASFAVSSGKVTTAPAIVTGDGYAYNGVKASWFKVNKP